MSNLNPAGKQLLKSAQLALPQKSEIIIGPGQNRNAVASGRLGNATFPKKYRTREIDPTLQRYGSDFLQVHRPTFEAKIKSAVNSEIELVFQIIDTILVSRFIGNVGTEISQAYSHVT